MQNRISISIGPGQHDQVILDALLQSGQLKQSFHTFPDLRLSKFEHGKICEQRNIQSFRHLQRLVWSAWRRVPYYNRFETPRSWFLPLADKIISRNLEPCDLFIGWLQISLNSMKRARQLGMKTIHEHQMSHISTWTELVTREYKQWTSESSGYHSLFPDRLVGKIKEEYEEADVINVLSTYAKKSFVENGISENKVIVTEFGIDTKKFWPSEVPKEHNDFRILYVGRLELLKGIQYLLQAFSSIKGRNFSLTLVGPILPEIKPILKQYNDDRIEIVGAVSQDSLVSYYQQADLFVFPSINDAFGLVVLEAMACGVPVVTTDHSCGHDLVTDGKDGFVVPSRDAEAIKEKIEILLDDHERLQLMGREAVAKVRSNYTLQHFQARYLDLCRRVLDE